MHQPLCLTGGSVTRRPQILTKLIPVARGFRSCLGLKGLALAGALSFLAREARAQTVDLGSAAPFGVLAGSGITVAGAVNSTIIKGDIGTFPTTTITGLGNVVLIGVNHGGDAVTQNAKQALLTAYNSAASRAAGVVFAPAANLGGQTLVAGVYRDPTSFGLTGTLTLNAAGNPNAVWIFQMGSTLGTASFSKVVLVGGAQACHVFWQVGSSATLGTSSLFEGNILAFTSITLTTGATVDGRLLALNGAVTLDTNTITVIQCAELGLGTTDTTASPTGVNGVIEMAIEAGILTPNQTETARALINLNSAPQSKLADFLGKLAFTDLPGALDQIAPEELTSIYNLGFAQFDTEVFSLQQRLQDIRDNGEEPAPADRIPDGKSLDGKSLEGKSVAEDKESPTGRMPGADHWGFFITETGEFSTLGDTSNASGFDSKSAGTTLGLDRRLGDHVVLGITLGYARTDSDLNDGGKLTSSGGKAALYAMYHRGGFYTEGLVGGGYATYDTRRTALDGSAYGSASGEQFDAYYGVGYGMKLGSFTLTPIGSLLYTLVGINSFDEHGSLLPLHIDSQNESSLRSRLGMRAAYTSHVGHATVTPSVSAEWQHEFLNTELPLSASFQQGSNTDFTVHGGQLGRDSVLLTAAVNVAWNRYACYLAYQADVGVTNYGSQTVLAGVRVAW